MFSREFTPVFSQNLSVGNKKMYTEIFPISTKQNYLMFQIPISEVFCVDFFFLLLMYDHFSYLREISGMSYGPFTNYVRDQRGGGSKNADNH